MSRPKHLEQAERLSAASDVLGMLYTLFSAIGKLDGHDAAGLAKVGCYLADDWANALDVDAEKLRQQVAGGAQ